MYADKYTNYMAGVWTTIGFCLDGNVINNQPSNTVICTFTTVKISSCHTNSTHSFKQHMPPKLISKDTQYVTPLSKIVKPKRIRVSKACEGCRKRKIKCDGVRPCKNCVNFKQSCDFAQDPSDSGSSNGTAGNKVSKASNNNTASLDPSKVYQSIVQKLYPNLQISNESELQAFLQKLNTTDPASTNFQSAKPNPTPTPTPTPPYSYIPGKPEQHKHHQQEPSIKISLPPKEIAVKLILKTWNEACILFRFYHRPTFLHHFNSLYETSPANYTHLQLRFLPLIYSVIACGSLFAQGDNEIDNKYLKDEGYKYFIAARKLIDLTNPTNLENIQTIFMLTIFLQCSAKISICYSYIGIALRSALRLNYHKCNAEDDYITSECKKRLFWTVYKFEIYINSMLGLPNCNLDVEDIEIGMPLDIDDINITAEKLLPQADGKLSSCGINNHHTKLMLILGKIVKKLYGSRGTNSVEFISRDQVIELENELKLWRYESHSQMQFDNVNISKDYLKANRLLQLDYLHVEIMLYRPFITFLRPDTVHSKDFRISFALRCFEISKKIIQVANGSIKLINGSYWFSIYTVFFALTCLIYYFLEINNQDPETNYFIELGKRVLLNMKKASNTAERIYNLLNAMFENYNKSLKLTFNYNEENGGNDYSDNSVKLRSQESENRKKQQELNQKLAQTELLKNQAGFTGMNLQRLINGNEQQQQQQQQQQQSQPTTEPTSQLQQTIQPFNSQQYQSQPSSQLLLPSQPQPQLPITHFEAFLPNFLQDNYYQDQLPSINTPSIPLNSTLSSNTIDTDTTTMITSPYQKIDNISSEVNSMNPRSNFSNNLTRVLNENQIQLNGTTTITGYSTTRNLDQDTTGEGFGFDWERIFGKSDEELSLNDV